MPTSKKRKRKNGKVVGNGKAGQLRRHNERLREQELRESFDRFQDKESNVTLQDLIDVVAAQEHYGVANLSDVFEVPASDEEEEESVDER